MSHLANAKETLSVRGGAVDFVRREVCFVDGARRGLSKREAALLRYLAANIGRVISRDEILSQVWRLDPAHTVTRTVDVHISHLRRKLQDDPKRPAVLLTFSRRGYMLATNGHGANARNGGS